MTGRDPVFLTLAEVVDIHGDQIQRYGGRPGIRDIRLLESAVAMPRASFGGESLHLDLFEMAAAYAFHIVRNHPFLDGNKRAALASALVFLEVNELTLVDPEERLYDALIGVVRGEMMKADLASLLRTLPRE